MNNEKEIWRDIAGYKGSYQISNFGRVKSIAKFVNNNGGKQFRKEIILKRHITKCEYFRIGFGDKKYYFIHRLIAIAFIPNPNNYKYVLHNDGNSLNNNINNLRWGTQSMNSSDALEHGTIGKKVIADGKEYNSVRECARNYNTGPSTILNRIKSKNFNFKYK